MTAPCNEEIEAVLHSRGFSRFYVRPPWYRLYHSLGIRVPTPSAMKLQEHLFYGGIIDLILLSVIFGAAVQLGIISRFPVVVIVILPILLPITNWMRYGKARREIRMHHNRR